MIQLAPTSSPAPPRRYQAITASNAARQPFWELLDAEVREAVEVVATVLPFRTNNYVVDELIDWARVPDDPIFQLTFPQRGMLAEADYIRIRDLRRSGADKDTLSAAANEIRRTLNPHPAGQLTHNVPHYEGRPLLGAQHKYRETVLFFPSRGQTCHAYCSFCFRWAQFVGLDELKFANDEIAQLIGYLRTHPEVTDVLFTGGDPLIMSAANLRRYITPLLEADLGHIQTIRIGTKSVGYWPQRFVSDPDADELLRLFEQVSASGRHLALMGHYSHPVELASAVAQTAVQRIRSAGANVRMQSPVIRRVNDDPNVWIDLWNAGVRLGAIPYYMFVERDTGARDYFQLSLARCWEIYQSAYHRVSGVARTVRGPSMSAFPGKVHVLGTTQIGDDPVFVLQYLQARQPALVRRPFFAKFDPQATWFDQLQPYAAADAEFFPSQQMADELHVPLVQLSRSGVS